VSTRRAHRHETTRREILDAAWTRAEEVGIAGISLRDLAEAVGMRAPSLYTYFPGKDSIYDAMFAEGYTELTAHYDRWEEDLEGRERAAALTAAVEQFIEFCQASPARYQLMFTRAVPGWEPSPEAYAASEASYRRSAESLADLGIEGREALDLFTAITAGLAAQQMANDPGGDRWRSLAGEAVDLLLEHIDEERGTR